MTAHKYGGRASARPLFFSTSLPRPFQVFGRDCPEGLRNIRVHDLKHTFGRRLRATGVSFEDRQDLLGHKSGRITTHYSAVELQNLIDARVVKILMRLPDGNISAAHLTVPYNRPIRQRNSLLS